MNSEPPTGDELNSMLVTMKQNVLERTTESPRRKRHRNLGLGLGLAALLAIGGGSGALALGMLPSPFQASAPATPTSTPTPTPTVTRTATPRPTPTVAPVVAPVPSAPIDCATLASGVRMDLFIPSPERGTPDFLSPVDASVLESGILSCEWGSTEQPYSGAQVRVSSDREAGLDAIGELRAAGAQRAGAGEASAMSCAEYGCEASLVTGTWWLEFSSSDVDARPETVSAETRSANATAALTTMVTQLDGLSPTPSWTRPASSWSQADCAALAPAVPLGEIVGNPLLEGPRAVQSDYGSKMLRTADRTLECLWELPYIDYATAPPGPADVYVSLNSGSGWAVRAVDSMSQLQRSPATVAGADEAEFVCVHGEGSTCYVNVLTDGTWLQVRAGNTYQSDLEGPLIAAAEAIVATRPAS